MSPAGTTTAPVGAADPPAREPRTVACLCGPTASGKTALALALAASLPGRLEIVSVDSALVYRGMDIGTAKPTPAEQAAVPHHLIDVRDPWDPYSAADFARDAQRCLAEIHGRGRVPLLVGGTMLYFKALFDGLDTLPPADPAVRAAVAAEAARRGWPALHADLMSVDPRTASRLAPADAQRISRALEVFRQTGQPISSLQRRVDPAPSPSAGGDGPPPWRPRYVSLEPDDRRWLHERIERRVDAMLAAGLVDEVRRLAEDPRIHADLPALRAVGYRQTWEALRVDRALAAPGAQDRLRERCIAATRQLAKRQLTWLRSLPDRWRVPCDATNSRNLRVTEVSSYLFAPLGVRPPERGVHDNPDHT